MIVYANSSGTAALVKRDARIEQNHVSSLPTSSTLLQKDEEVNWCEYHTIRDEYYCGRYEDLPSQMVGEGDRVEHVNMSSFDGGAYASSIICNVPSKMGLRAQAIRRTTTGNWNMGIHIARPSSSGPHFIARQSAPLNQTPFEKLMLQNRLVDKQILERRYSATNDIGHTSSLSIVPEKPALIILHEESITPQSSASASYNTGPPKSSAFKLTIATSNVISTALASVMEVCEIRGNHGLDKEGNPKNRVELHTPAVNPFVSWGSFCTSVNQEGNNGPSSILTPPNFSSPLLFTSTNVSVTSSAQGESELSNGEGKGKSASPFSFSTYTVSLQKDACRYGLVPHSYGTDFVSAGEQSLVSSSSPSVPYTSSLFSKSQSSIATSDVMSGHDEIKLAMATSDVTGALFSGTTICGLENEDNNTEKQVELPRSRSGSIGISVDQEGNSGPGVGCAFVDQEGNGSDANSSPLSSPTSTLSFMNKLTAGYNLMPHSSGTDSSPIVNGGGSSSFGSSIWFPLKIPWFPRQIPWRLNALLKNFIAHLRAIGSGKINCSLVDCCTRFVSLIQEFVILK